MHIAKMQGEQKYGCARKGCQRLMLKPPSLAEHPVGGGVPLAPPARAGVRGNPAPGTAQGANYLNVLRAHKYGEATLLFIHYEILLMFEFIECKGLPRIECET